MIFINNGEKYEILENKNNWIVKLITKNIDLKAEFNFSKKDFPSIEDVKSYIKKELIF